MSSVPCSMTGFGHGESSFGGEQVTCEVRSVNSRHLDLRLRLPRELAGLEAELRSEVSRSFTRGQVDVQIHLPASVEAPRVAIDAAVAGTYVDAARELERLGAGGTLDAAALLVLPGVVRQLDPDPPGPELTSAVWQAVRDACAATLEMRRREGAALEADLRARLETLDDGIAAVEAEASTISKRLRERLERRVAQLAPELDVDPARFDQEIVLFADRADVTEELVRLRSHIDQFRETLGRPGIIGRRLEFLLQEIGREVNTIGSKAQAAKISSSVVDLKSEIERVREQVLNVE